MYCNEYNTNKAWCLSCDPEITIQGWTSGNKDADYCIKDYQLKTLAYEEMIEWIPFDKLMIFKSIGKGGFSSVFSAIWADGIRKIDAGSIQQIDSGYDNYLKVREPSSIVALKSLSNSKENPLDFLKEFKNHMECMMKGIKLKIYGLTQNTETNEYFMVFQYANNGSLHSFLSTKFQDLTWQIKLKILKDILLDLRDIHEAGYIHADLHSGNVLLDHRMSKSMQSYISDLGLSKMRNENVSDGIYGVMPYVAPEVLKGQKFTQASDIYSFGVIMSEISTGQRPFDGESFDLDLMVKICNGLQPVFASGTPECYIELAKQCMNLDPQKRPNVSNIWVKLVKWNVSMKGSDEKADEIKKQFLDANKIVKNLPIITPKHSGSIYTSKLINTSKISSAFKALDSLDSTRVNFYIPDNF
ncbi:kinase-like domain-containing protein [Gigaspora rosea]|uniref:Kinase-like domain-containing protein n=1 Tax=Gigaspora rosea TaxID=44941 RepID=A0A397VMF2_9GLOM|nr:kinase-like domain-containing protein [Gigaspora rosea]